MPRIFNSRVPADRLRRLVGDMDQIAGCKLHELADGNEKGVSAADVWTGSGFQFTVLFDRGMDISAASYQGKSLCWRSTTGDVSPAFYEPEGLGWLRGFYGGLAVTCGLTYAGAPTEDEGEALGLHGRIANIPAREVSTKARWQGNNYVITLEGKMRETVVFGPNVTLTRRITARLGESRLAIRDVVENEGFETQPLQILYHCNFGYPVVSPTSELVSTTTRAIPRDEEAEDGKESYGKFHDPTPGYNEKCYYHNLRTDAKGAILMGIVNRDLGGDQFGAYIKYDKNQLPRFNQWKMMGEQTYVVGLEPANCRVEGRAKDRADGVLEFIKPGERRQFDIEIGALADAAQVESFENTVASIMKRKARKRK